MALVVPARLVRVAVLLGAVALLAVRFFHLSEPLDLPHAWRQAETAGFTRAFNEHGIDLLRPTVAWLGDRGAHAFELPLPQALTAVLYRVFGENLVLDRLVTLAFFVGSAAFLFGIVKRLSTEATASIATLVYLAAPLGQMFSRAVQLDFPAVCLAHAMLWFFLRAADDGRRRWFVVGAAAAAFAFLLKAHYAFYLAVPLAMFVLPRISARAAIPWLLAALVPTAVFVAWRYHVHVLNHAGPAFPHIPRGAPPTDTMTEYEFYFGSWAQRADLGIWLHLAKRIASEVFGWLGLALFGAGLIAPGAEGEERGVLLGWLAAALGFLLLFFNASVLHDYYQIPLLAPAAIFVARGIVWLTGRLPRWRLASAGALVMAIGVENVTWAETHHYYVPCPLINGYGRAIGDATPPGSVIIIAGNDFKYSDPSMLYGAHRYGWSLNTRKLTPELVSSLSSHGATHLVLFGGPIPSETPAFLRTLARAGHVTEGGREVAWIFHLRTSGTRSVP